MLGVGTEETRWVWGITIHTFLVKGLHWLTRYNRWTWIDGRHDTTFHCAVTYDTVCFTSSHTLPIVWFVVTDWSDLGSNNLVNHGDETYTVHKFSCITRVRAQSPFVLRKDISAEKNVLPDENLLFHAATYFVSSTSHPTPPTMLFISKNSNNNSSSSNNYRLFTGIVSYNILPLLVIQSIYWDRFVQHPPTVSHTVYLLGSFRTTSSHC